VTGGAAIAMLGAAASQAAAAARAALEAADLAYRIQTFTEAGHAFFNDTGARFNAPAAEAAWHQVLTWFGKHVD